MNPLLGIAKITNNRKIRKWCAIKRYRQYEAKWAKEKAAAVTTAIEQHLWLKANIIIHQ